MGLCYSWGCDTDSWLRENLNESLDRSWIWRRDESSRNKPRVDYFISLGYAQICIQPQQAIGAIWNLFGAPGKTAFPKGMLWCHRLHSGCSEIILRTRPLSVLPLCFANNTCPPPAGTVNTSSSPAGWLVFKSCRMWNKNTVFSFKKENPSTCIIYIIQNRTEIMEERIVLSSS